MKIYFVRPNIKQEGEEDFLKLISKFKINRTPFFRVHTINDPIFLRFSNILSKKFMVPVSVDYNLDSEEHFELKMINFINNLISYNKDLIVILPLRAIHFLMSYLTKIPLEHIKKIQIDFNGLSLLDSLNFKGGGISYIKFLNDTTHLKFP